MARRARLRKLLATSALVAPLALSMAAPALSAPTLAQLSSDPFTNVASQHATQVEPDSFAFGSTIVMAVQTGRIFGGGSADIGWATSIDGGATWAHGFLPGITTAQGGGTYSAVSDPSVTYDSTAGAWIISSLAIKSSSTATLTSRSVDGGLTWSNPVTVATGASLDKDWIVCDNGPASVFKGHCYTEWDDNGAGNRIKMSTSVDGGVSWQPAKNTANNASGLGGQPVVQPNGTVIVPIDNGSASSVQAFTSTNGGSSWTATKTISPISDHGVAGSLRTLPLPSAEIDAAGKVYVVWQDCRFRTSCSSNDIVMSTSTDGLTWTAPVRIPIDKRKSGVDHFIPGIAVDPATSGATAHLGLAYYYYPVAGCSTATCQLDIGFVSSTDGGTSWSRPLQLAGPMTISWLPNTSLGRMVGDYISVSFVNGGFLPALPVAAAPSSGNDCFAAPTSCNEALFTTATGLEPHAVEGGTVTAGGEQPVPGAASDHPLATTPPRAR